MIKYGNFNNTRNNKFNSWIYVGEWENGQKNGFGEFTSPDGINYKGEYKGGLFNGEGIYNWGDGRKLVGKFKDGAFWTGEEYNKLGKIIGKYIDGVFLNNK